MKNKKILLKTVCFALLFAFFALVPTEAFAEAGSSWQTGGTFEIDFRIKDLFSRKNKSSEEELLLCPGGEAFGVKICASGVRVVKASSKSDESGLMPEDKIIKVSGEEVFSVEEVKEAIRGSDGEEILLDVERSGKRIKIYTKPIRVGDDYQLGVLLTDGTAGIGTITYIDPKTGAFGGLGHGICDTGSALPLPMKSGIATSVVLGGAIKGESGKPGELRGVLMEKRLGVIYKNTECGVFGRLSDGVMENGNLSAPMRVGSRAEVREGEATIISTVKNGKSASFKVSIENIDRTADGSKCFRIKVTDDTLIALTGGIVRGMSGSPIIQDGKLIGAVTHVMVANPTEGYGIFIENMLSAAQNQVIPKAA